MADARVASSRRFTIVGAGMAGLALLGAPVFLRPAPRLLWNASASAPVGLYSVSPNSALGVGDLVIARAPAHARAFAAKRQYLPLNVPLVKRIAALSPSTICAIGPRLTVNGRFAATRLHRDRQGRAMPWWSGCRHLRSGEILLLMSDKETSFDGRYFGPSPRSDVLGRTRPLWLR